MIKQESIVTGNVNSGLKNQTNKGAKVLYFSNFHH